MIYLPPGGRHWGATRLPLYTLDYQPIQPKLVTLVDIDLSVFCRGIKLPSNHLPCYLDDHLIYVYSSVHRNCNLLYKKLPLHGPTLMTKF